MRKFLNKLWRFITTPFRLFFLLIRLPFVGFKRIQTFLNETPEEHSLADTMSIMFQDKGASSDLAGEIDALRKHLLRAVLIVVTAVGISFAFAQDLLTFLAQPIPGGIEALKAIEVTESIGVFMRISLMSGLALAMPYVTFEIWLFAAPALMPRSRKFGLVGIPLAMLLFSSGAAFAYFVMMPTSLSFLLNFMGIQTELRPQSYFMFVTGLMFWIGVAFEFPLVIYVLTMIGFVKPQVLKTQWRLALVLISVISAAITPTVDPINMALVMLPMSLLYFISIGLSYIAYIGRESNIKKQLATGNR